MEIIGHNVHTLFPHCSTVPPFDFPTLWPYCGNMDTEIKFRVSTEDKARFERAAKMERRKLSDWIRLTLLDASGPPHSAYAAKVAGDAKIAGMKVVADPLVPDGRAELRDQKGEIIGVITGLSSERKKDAVPPEKVPEAAPKSRPLSREEREAKIAEFQRKAGMGGGKK